MRGHSKWHNMKGNKMNYKIEEQKIRNKEYRIHKSERKKIIELSISKLENIIELRENFLDEKEYLGMLCKYKNWLETEKKEWQKY